MALLRGHPRRGGKAMDACINTILMKLKFNEDVMLHILFLILKSATDEINTEIKLYQSKLSLKDMHSVVKSYGFKFHERHRNFQNKMNYMIKSQRAEIACIQLVCVEFNKLTRALKLTQLNSETLIVSKCTMITYMYRNMVKSYFRTASQHLFHPVLHTT